MYSLLFVCCEEHFVNLAYEYPTHCDDNGKNFGIDLVRFNNFLKYRIPELARDGYNKQITPNVKEYVSPANGTGGYNQYALLDLIELIATKAKDIKTQDFHSYMQHTHILLMESTEVRGIFRQKINDIFQLTGLLYTLTESGQVERVPLNTTLSSEIEESVASLSANDVKEMLQLAIKLFKSPKPEMQTVAVDKIWDTFELMKTYTAKSKDETGDSAEALLDRIVPDNPDLRGYISKEFKELWDIGNKIKIRHYGAFIPDVGGQQYRDYFFNRCLSLIALAIPYLEE